MLPLPAKVVDDTMQEFGFVNTDAAGLFRWWEFPRPRDVKEDGIPVYIRAMYYEARGELQVWLLGNGTGLRQDVFGDYIESTEEVVNAISQAARARQQLAVHELVRYDDDRVQPIPQLVAAARSENKSDQISAERVIADWLLDHGVVF